MVFKDIAVANAIFIMLLMTIYVTHSVSLSDGLLFTQYQAITPTNGDLPLLGLSLTCLVQHTHVEINYG